MGVCNRVGRDIEAAESVIEATIKTKLDDIKSDHIKTINSLDTKYQL